MKTTYSTITLRYVHDVVTGEFANIGVVLYPPDKQEKATQTVLEQAKLLCADWAV